jgi:uncharacterized phage protein gp47/JayE
MYEQQTEETILKRMMKSIAADVDKREGSIAYDACMPAAIEFSLMYATVDYFLKNTFGDTAERSYLLERALERRLTPKEASAAKAKGAFTPADLEIPIGTRFSYDDLNYVVTEKISSGIYFLSCETLGTVGNKPQGKLIPIDYVQNLQTANLTEITVPGEDEEDTESFRARYLASFDSQAYGGNIADYREKVNNIDGVGGVKVYPVWAGGGTVKIVFMTSEFKVPAEEFVSEVQTLIDPVINSGEGVGIAPIGHHVTVEGVKNSSVAISLTLEFASGEYESYREAVENAIDEYFLELNKKWQETQKAEIGKVSNSGIVIRVSQIESRLLALDGIEDVQHTMLNGSEENLQLDKDELAVRGELNVNDT